MHAAPPFPGAILLLLFSLLLSPMISNAGLDPRSIEAARQYSESHNGVALIVKEGGKLRYQKYYNGYSGAPLHIFSGTKSFFGILAVMAEEDRLLKLDEKVSDTILEWRSDRARASITLRETLNFTSGLETGFQKIYGRSSHDKIALSATLKSKRPRGRAFIYGPGNMNVFCEVLRRKLRSTGISYEEYLQRKLIRPLGISISRWREDDHGNVVPSAGMYMTWKDWMKLGDLINNGGVYNGRRLVRTESLRQCFAGTSINPSFGLGFWINGYASRRGARECDPEEWLDEDPMPENWSRTCLSKKAPADLIVSLGSTFQRLYIVPSMDLIVVHHGTRGNEFRDAEFLEILFRNASRPRR